MAADMPPATGSRPKLSPRRRLGRKSTPSRGPSTLHLQRLEEREVPAGLFTGTVFVDTNANGRFDTIPVSIPLVSGNGFATTAVEQGFSGLASPFDPIDARVPVTVQAFDAANNLAGQTQTDVDGTYTLTVATAGSYRLEFSNLPAGVQFGASGADSGTAVQFRAVVDGGTTRGVNVSVVRAEEVSGDNPLLLTQSFVFGAFDSENAGRAVIQGFPYNSGSGVTGVGDGQRSEPGFVLPFENERPVAIRHDQVGATWGLAYNRTNNDIYAAAFQKRHSGFGPGTGNPATAHGQIYRAAAPVAGSATRTTTAAPLVNLAELVPGSAGTNYRATPAFTDPANTQGFDPFITDGLVRFTDADGVVRDLGWDAVGKNGLGGLDVDPSGRFLYTVALGDRRLYVIDLANPTVGLQSFALPSPTSVTGKSVVNPQGDLRPFAVQFFRGSIYVGAVNSGESTISSTNPAGDASALRAFVFEFRLGVDNSGRVTTGGGRFVNQAGVATATEAVLEVPLNYPRGYAHIGTPLDVLINDPNYSGPEPGEWNVWSPTFRTTSNPLGPNNNIGTYPQPMLTGLAFDSAGNVTLGLRDRSGDQFGAQTPTNPLNPTKLYFAIPAGDTLKAFANPAGAPTRWTLESNGQAPAGGPVSRSGVGNGQGPGGGEFYADDYLVPGIVPGFQDHQELSTGGVLHLTGFNETATTAFDPAQETRRYNTGGVRWFADTGANAGGLERTFELYLSPVNIGIIPDTFAKANGVGDLIAVTQAPVEIGNRVWADLNRDGQQGATEPGLGGVQVQLFKNGVAELLATAVTDDLGNYYFTSLADPGPALRVPGKAYGVRDLTPNMDYEVRIPLGQPALRALTLTTANVGPDATDSDAVARNGFGVIPVTTAGLIPGAADHTNDAGFVFNLTLGDFVWNDLNNDGRFQVGEPALAGVRVELVDPATGTTISATTTNAQGGYLFTGLNPGQYQVRIPLGEANPALAGFASSTGTPGSPFGPNEFADGVPVQAPNNADSGTTVGNAVLGPVVTLAVGTAPVGETDPALFPNGNNGIPDPAGVTDDNSTRNQDFGFFQPISIGDTVWLDANNNGFRDPGEAGIEGVIVQLLDVSRAAPSVVAVTTTNVNGGYLFTNLVTGTYQVRIVRGTATQGLASSTGANAEGGPFEPAGIGDALNDFDHGTENGPFVDGRPIAVTPGGATPVDPATVPAGLPFDNAPAGSRYRTQDFGFYQPFEIGNLVFEDVNNNGVRDPGEPGVSGVTVELFRVANGVITQVAGPTGLPRVETTDANGNYLFGGLTAGEYIVRIVTPEGFASSTGVVGSPVGPFEPGLPGTDLTDNADHGTAVAGTVFIQTSGVTLGDPALTPDAARDGTPGRANLRQDFGLVRTLTIGDLVFDDINNNGFRDASEPGIGGVTVRLLDGLGNTVATRVTAADGGYLFTNLIPGQYQVEVVIPTGYISSTGGAGSPFEPVLGDPPNNFDHGTTVGGGVRGPVLTVAPGTAPLDDLDGPASATLLDAGTPNANSTRNQDFGFFRPLVLGDLVWLDDNDNGVRDPGEQGLAGIGVILRDTAGNPIATTITDADGNYLFTNLVPGTYQVEILSGDFLSSTGGPGSPFEPAAQSTLENQDKGTEAGVGVIRAPQVTLGLPGSALNPSLGGFGNLTQDFGLIFATVTVPPPPPPPILPPVVPPPPAPARARISGLVYVDQNANGVRDGNEPPIPNTRIFLTGIDENGNRVNRNTLTGTDGRYSFTDLVPGLYTVRQQQPDGQIVNGLTFVGSLGGTLGTDVISGIRLNPNDAGVSYDFSEIPTGATFGYVWIDQNRNGVFEAGELPIPGVPVTISGTVLPGTRFERPLTASDVRGGLTVTTNSLGRYDFPSLPLGVYNLRQTQPVDFVDWMEQDGDPFAGRPAIANDLFTGVAITAVTPIRGPFNFGEIVIDVNENPGRSPLVSEDPSKRDFLGSTNQTADRPRNSPAFVIPTPPTAGVVSPVAQVQLLPTINALGGQDPSYLVAGTGAGSSPLVRVFDYSTGLEKFRFLAYEADYTGGVRVATGDINGDGVPDIITATGVGGGPRLRAFSGLDGSVLADFFAYEETYRGGLSLAVADVTGDGVADLITGTDQGGGPRVRVFDGRTLAVVQDFFAFDSAQRGGVRVAAADVTGDGRADIVAGSGPTVPTRVRVFDSATGAAIRDFAPFEPEFTGGVNVAVADYNGDGVPDIVTGADQGGGPRVSVFNGLNGGVLGNFFAFNPEFTGGARVAAADLTGDGTPELAVAAGAGGGARVTIYSGAGVRVVEDFFAFDPTSSGGSFIGAGTTPRRVVSTGPTPAAPGQFGNPLSLGDPLI